MASMHLSIRVAASFRDGSGDFTGCNLSSVSSKAHHDNSIICIYCRVQTLLSHHLLSWLPSSSRHYALGSLQLWEYHSKKTYQTAWAHHVQPMRLGNKLSSSGMWVSWLMPAPSLLVWFFSVANGQNRRACILTEGPGVILLSGLQTPSKGEQVKSLFPLVKLCPSWSPPCTFFHMAQAILQYSDELQALLFFKIRGLFRGEVLTVGPGHKSPWSPQQFSLTTKLKARDPWQMRIRLHPKYITGSWGSL